jgi:anti-sigma regulatory factor (Ser/Thr protein kinase)
MCSVTARAELVLPMSSESPAAARAFARRSGCPAHALEVLEDALLLISELVTNSVLHGGPPIVLAIECDGEALNVRVRDGAADLPVPRVAGADDESGRGLTLVELLTDTWGVEPVSDEHGAGKQVWFQLRRPA